MLPIVLYASRQEALDRVFNRSASFDPDVDKAVVDIIADVRSRGDEALIDLTGQFDGVTLSQIRVPSSDLQAALEGLDQNLLGVIERAIANIREFHSRQARQSWFMDRPDGTVLGQRVVPIERVGLYVPGGTAVYPSSVLMNVIPAQIAGVQDIVIVSPPGEDGLPHPLVLAAAALLGIDEVYAVGGAQAIAALAYGTESVRRVDKIVGPGNAYVAAAKRMVFGPVAIDSVAGPSEIVILADSTADPRHIAADLLSQAEHDTRASAILVTPDANLAPAVAREVTRFAENLPRKAIIRESVAAYGAAIVTADLAEAIDCVNELAPEHLEIITSDPWEVLPRIRHAGAIFLGANTPESVGDYFAGPNHVLPTGGTARYASALSVDDFIRSQSVIAYSHEALKRDGQDIVDFARAEELDAHALAVSVRLDFK
jgi:histidinol dehydrogenase